MGRMPRGAYLWPGLPQMWSQGSPRALAWALGATVLLNLAVASSLVWSELLTPAIRNLVWAAVVGLWVGSAVVSYRWQRRHPVEPYNGSAKDTFVVGLDHYLKGNWLEAERVLNGLLEENPRDVDAGLMLASLFRHTRRYDKALKQLDRLERLEASCKWQEEIRRERQLVRQARSQRDDAPPTPY